MEYEKRFIRDHVGELDQRYIARILKYIIKNDITFTQNKNCVIFDINKLSDEDIKYIYNIVVKNYKNQS